VDFWVKKRSEGAGWEKVKKPQWNAQTTTPSGGNIGKKILQTGRARTRGQTNGKAIKFIIKRVRREQTKKKMRVKNVGGKQDFNQEAGEKTKGYLEKEKETILVGGGGGGTMATKAGKVVRK